MSTSGVIEKKRKRTIQKDLSSKEKGIFRVKKGGATVGCIQQERRVKTLIGCPFCIYCSVVKQNVEKRKKKGGGRETTTPKGSMGENGGKKKD